MSIQLKIKSSLLSSCSTRHAAIRRTVDKQSFSYQLISSLVDARDMLPLVYHDGRDFVQVSNDQDLQAAFQWSEVFNKNELTLIPQKALQNKEKAAKFFLALLSFVFVFLFCRSFFHPLTFFALFTPLVAAGAAFFSCRKLIFLRNNNRCNKRTVLSQQPNEPKVSTSSSQVSTVRDNLLQLRDLGFLDVKANLAALEKHSGDINACVQELLDTSK